MPEAFTLVKLNNRIFIPYKRKYRIIRCEIFHHDIILRCVIFYIAGCAHSIVKCAKYIAAAFCAFKSIMNIVLVMIFRAGVRTANNRDVMAYGQPPVDLMDSDGSASGDPWISYMVVYAMKDFHDELRSNVRHKGEAAEKFLSDTTKKKSTAWRLKFKKVQRQELP